MRYGIVILPEFPWSEAAPRWRRSEELGFDHAWTYDHLVWGGLIGHPWYGTMPTLTAAALVTSRIGLGTFVSSPNFRHPMTFLRDAQSVADISGGRLSIGLGSGGEPDGTLLGQSRLSPGNKVDRLGEFSDLFTQLLATDHVDYDGTWFQVRDARTEPLEPMRPAVPVLIAGNGPRSIGVACRYGSGWVTTGPPRADDLSAWWSGVARLTERVDTSLEASGRTSQGFARYLSVDASGSYSLQSIDAFDDAVGRAAELGFSDVVVHWPRPSEPYAGSEGVLDEVAERIASRTT